MPNLSRLILLLAFCFIAPVALAQNATFSHSGLARDAERYESYLKSHWKAGQQTPAQLRQTGAKALAEGNDPRAASRSFAGLLGMR